MADFLESDVVVDKGRLMLDGIGVDEEPAVVLLLEEAKVIPVGVGGVVDEDDLQLPLNLPRIRGHPRFY